MKNAIKLYALLIFLNSCSTYQIALNEGLKQNAHVYEVKGRQGLLINQKLTFGNYEVKNINRGWTFAYNIPFIVKFSGASEKLSFQINWNNTICNVNALGKVKVSELILLNDFFNIPINNTDVLAGVIEYNNQNWNYCILNSNNSRPTEVSDGFVKSDTAVIEIKNIRKLANKQTRFSQLEIHGYEFIYHDNIIGSVELINKGRVFLNKNNTTEINMIVSSISSVLLLKNNLDEERQMNNYR